MSIFETIKNRRSIGKMTEQRPTRQQIERMLEAATHAPNHHKVEPWKFFVLAGEVRRELGQVMAEALAERLRTIDALQTVRVREDKAFVGGGSLPDQAMKTCVVEIQARDITDAELARRLRTGSPAVLGRLRQGKLVLDLRTVLEWQQTQLAEAVQRAVDAGPPAKSCS